MACKVLDHSAQCLGTMGLGTGLDVDLVRRAVDGDAAARHALVLRLSPVVHRRVCRPLAIRRGGSVQRSEVLDLVQQILLLLFDKDSRVLRSWDPTRGLSLSNFVGLVAEREAKAVLRSGRRSAWAENPTAEDDVSTLAVDDAVLEDDIVSRGELRTIWHRLEEALSPRSIELFRALFIEQLSIEEISGRFGMSSNALYTFRSRLRQQVQAIRRELSATQGPPPVATTRRLPMGPRRDSATRRGQRASRGEQ